MFYRDIILTVPKQDLTFWRTALLAKVHETFHKHECAVAFPNWADGKENCVDSFDTFTHHAEPGRVVRFFADDEARLEALYTALELTELESKGVAEVGPVRPAPTASRGVAFCRNRRTDGFIRKARRSAEPIKERHRREAAVRATHHRQAYVKMCSSKSEKPFSLYIERRDGAPSTGPCNITSYGLSRTSEPYYLPDF